MFSTEAMSAVLVRMAGLVPAVAAACAMAQPTMSTVVREGEFHGNGFVTSVDGVVVNNNGSWLVRADTNGFDTTTDGVLLGNAGLLFQEGSSVSAPTGATISAWDDLTLNNGGHSGWNWFLGNMTTGTDSGLFYDSTLIIQEGTLSTAAGFSAGTIYTGYFGAKINDGNQILVVASVDDPAIASTTDRAVVRVDYNPSSGAYMETVIAKEADLLAGASSPIIEFGTDPQEFAINNAGTVMFAAEVSGGSSDAYYIGATSVAREGEDSGINGRVWEQLAAGRPLDLNNGGGYVFRGNLSGDTADDEVIVKNGQVFVREGQSLPAIAPYKLTGFGTSAPLFIDDNGNVLWYGVWNDPATSQNKGLFLNDQLLVQDGVTVVNGELVTSVRGLSQGYAMSDSGQHIIVRVVLGGALDAALLISFPGAACGNADFNGDGDIGTDADIEAFFACLAGNCCATCYTGGSDFNADGDAGTDADIESFFRVLAGGPC